MITNQPSDLPDDDQEQIRELVDEFTKRTEFILAAFAMGATFFEIEQYLDYLDATTHQTENQDLG
ncbi:MAG: hypothetical protein JXM70_22935 [Pirellulales bacterium]|nr:hypothetical protein [Pirellulales bacterium]